MAKPPRESEKSAEEIAPLRGGSSPEQFWKYWENIEKAYPQRTYAYLYRGWPVIDRKLTGHKHKTLEKIDFRPPEKIIDTHGSGDYKLQLYDGVYGKILAITYTKLRDPQQPPRIDLRELKVGDPANAEFIADLRSRNVRIPGDEGENEMSSTLVEKLVDRAMLPAAPADGGSLQQAVAVMGTAAKSSNELLTSVFQQALSVQIDRPNPVDQLSQLVGVVEKLQRPDNSDKWLQVMQTMIAEGRADRAAMLTAVQQLTARPERDDEDDEEETITALLKKKIYEKALGLMDSDGTPAAPAGPSVFSSFVSMVKELAPLAKYGLEMYVANRMAAAGVDPAQVMEAAHNPAPSPAAPPPPPPAAAQAPPADPYQAILRDIERPLTRFFTRDDRGGAAFAELLIEYHGREIYDAVLAAGQDLLTTGINAHPRIGPLFKQHPERAQNFLSEFFHFDAIVAAAAEDETESQEASEGATPTTTTTAVVELPPSPAEKTKVSKKAKSGRAKAA